jgi:hypothetical protein
VDSDAGPATADLAAGWGWVAGLAAGLADVALGPAEDLALVQDSDGVRESDAAQVAERALGVAQAGSGEEPAAGDGQASADGDAASGDPVGGRGLDSPV